MQVQRRGRACLSCAIVLQARKRERAQLLGKHVQWVRCTRGIHVNVCACVRCTVCSDVVAGTRVGTLCRVASEVRTQLLALQCKASTRCTAEALTRRTV